MKISIFETVNASPHLETSLELAKQHLENGDEVCYYFLGHAVPYSDFMSHRSNAKFSYFLPERKGARKIGRKLNFISPESIVHLGQDARCEFNDTEDLRAYKYKNYSAGMSALSSLISKQKTARPNLHKERDLLEKIVVSGVAIYNYTLLQIARTQPDLVYLFNGRFANNRAILDAATESKTPYLVHERGANKLRYTTRNFTPHNFARIQEDIKDTWKSSPDLNKIDTAETFFKDRRNGVEQAWESFIAEQTTSFRSSDAAAYKKILAYFSTSEDEYAAVGDLAKWDRWPNQAAAVEDLIRIVERNPDFLLILRLHPHMRKKSIDDMKYWEDLKLPPNVRLVRPESELSTYSIVDAADIVLTCGSTVGIEAVYWGVPSICMGPSLYSDLDAVYKPSGLAELEALISRRKLDNIRSKSYPYGYYMQTFGKKFQHYEPKDLFSGLFLGTDLQSRSNFERALDLVTSQPIGRIKGRLSMVLKNRHLSKFF